MFKNFGLTKQIILALVLGIVIGIILYNLPASHFKDTILINGIFYAIGKMFISTLKMLIVPVVFFSLIVGVSSLDNIKQLGRIGIKTMSYYLLTTAFAITLALLIGTAINPGKGLDMTVISKNDVTINEPVPFFETIINIIPENPISSMAQANMLQVLFFAIIVGLVITILGENVPTIKKLASESNDLFLKMITLVMAFAPIGVLALTAKTFAELGYDVMLPLTKYLGIIFFVLALQVVFYLLLIRYVGNVSPLKFLNKVMPPLSIGFSTASSAAALPVSLRTAEESLGINKKVASFTLPLGATINMDGTAIMQGIATIFIAQVYLVDLAFTDYLIIIVTATLASIGTAAVPGAGLIMLSLVLTSVNLPIEGIALIIGIDRIVDMARTSINITGDLVGATIIAKSENELDLEMYNDSSNKLN
ncbi:dicarboxylate/amino acid:cation symporter [Sporosarcina sp. CAU 1771]